MWYWLRAIDLRNVLVYIEACVAVALLFVLLTKGDIRDAHINWEAGVAVTTLFLGFTTVYVGRAALNVDRQQAWRENDRRHVTALCLSIPFDHELFIAKGLFEEVVKTIRARTEATDPRQLLISVIDAPMNIKIGLLDRLVEQFSYFGVPVGSSLAAALSIILQSQRPRVPTQQEVTAMSNDQVEASIRSQLQQAQQIVEFVARALNAVKPWFDEARTAKRG